MGNVSRDDLIGRFSEEEISSLEDPANNGIAVTGLISKILNDAEEEVIPYGSVRYEIPLPSFPAVLVRAVCDVARFRLYKDRPTDEVKYRYERTIRWLERLAQNKVRLNFDAATPEALVQASTRAPSIGAHYGGGVFSDNALQRMVRVPVLYPATPDASDWPGL